MTNKLLNRIRSFIYEAVKSAQEESKEIIVELKNNNQQLVNKNKELEQNLVQKQEAYLKLFNDAIKQENNLKDRLSKLYIIIQHKDKEIEKWKHQAELGSKTPDRFAKQLEEKEQVIAELENDYAELENDYAQLEKRYSDSFEHFHTLRMICDDYKFANAELEQECEILKQFKNEAKEIIGDLKEENCQLQKDCQICENFIDGIPCKPLRDMDYDFQKNNKSTR